MKIKLLLLTQVYFQLKDLDNSLIKKAEKFLKNKNPRLITVSRLDKRKNHEKIIMALRNLKQIYPNIIYICIGYGDEEENIKKPYKRARIK